MIRGCGTRERGGVYLEVATSPFGRPIEDFLLDPPKPLPFAEQVALGIKPIGVSTLQAPDGVTHVVDWIGQTFYPNVADWIEEGRRFGISRRIPSSFPFELLSARSRLIVVHAKAYIANWAEYVAARARPVRCRRRRLEHEPTPAEMCVSLYWEDVDGGQRTPTGAREVVRAMPSFSYVASCAPDDLTPRYVPAFFGSFPLGRIVVVRDVNDAHRRALEKASRARIPVEEVDE